MEKTVYYAHIKKIVYSLNNYDIREALLRYIEKSNINSSRAGGEVTLVEISEDSLGNNTAKIIITYSPPEKEK